MELRTPRDRDGSFEPQLVKKNKTCIIGMNNQILALYARGMTTREITSVFKEMYDADVSPALISKITDAVIDQVVEWLRVTWWWSLLIRSSDQETASTVGGTII